MTLRKVADATKIAPKTLPARRKMMSVYAEEIKAILELEPPQGLLIPVPANILTSKYRRRIRAIVTRVIEPVSPHRYRVSVAVNGEILVGCHE
ncbi:hypothetical protein LCGC14_1468650 [marine sediment metagenome]|uniref:Uncharacterized protein n=1 Tax=marine sediment metagenome TaxID=412755 RepID=A0A0F9LTF3_9ZZZZ